MLRSMILKRQKNSSAIASIVSIINYNQQMRINFYQSNAEATAQLLK
jgi:hypothetical protein